MSLEIVNYVRQRALETESTFHVLMLAKNSESRHKHARYGASRFRMCELKMTQFEEDEVMMRNLCRVLLSPAMVAELIKNLIVDLQNAPKPEVNLTCEEVALPLIY